MLDGRDITGMRRRTGGPSWARAHVPALARLPGCSRSPRTCASPPRRGSGELCDLSAARLDARDAVERAGWALERVGLAGRGCAGGTLSHGDKRKLEMAMMLAAEPRVILLDEPMAGVSVEDVDGLVEVIRAVHETEGRTVLLVEHHMEVVAGSQSGSRSCTMAPCSRSTRRSA